MAAGKKEDKNVYTALATTDEEFSDLIKRPHLKGNFGHFHLYMYMPLKLFPLQSY